MNNGDSGQRGEVVESRPQRLTFVIVGAVLVGLLALIVSSGRSSQKSATPATTTTTTPASSSTEAAASTSLPLATVAPTTTTSAPSTIVSIDVTRLGLHGGLWLLPDPNNFASTHTLQRIDLATAKVTKFNQPDVSNVFEGVGLSGAIAFVDENQYFRVAADGNVISTNGAGTSAGPRVLSPGADGRSVWVSYGPFAEQGSDLRRLDDQLAPKTTVRLPSGSEFVAETSAGLLVNGPLGGIYLVDTNGTVLRKVSTGRALAFASDRIVRADCDDTLHCSLSAVALSTGSSLPIPFQFDASLFAGASVSPDGRRAVIDVDNRSALLVDLTNGNSTTLSVPFAQYPGAWSTDGRYLFLLRPAEHLLSAIEVASGTRSDIPFDGIGRLIAER